MKRVDDWYKLFYPKYWKCQIIFHYNHPSFITNSKGRMKSYYAIRIHWMIIHVDRSIGIIVCSITVINLSLSFLYFPSRHLHFYKRGLNLIFRLSNLFLQRVLEVFVIINILRVHSKSNPFLPL